MSEMECPDALMSVVRDAIFTSKFVRIASIMDLAVASGGKRYVSGNRYPSCGFPREIMSSANTRGSASSTFSDISRTVTPSGNVTRTGGRPYSPAEIRLAIKMTFCGALNKYAPDFTRELETETRKMNRKMTGLLMMCASESCFAISDAEAPRLITTMSPEGKSDGGASTRA